MLGILQVKLVVVLVLLKLVSASDDIDKVQYFKSLTPQERQEIFSTDDKDHVPEFEIVNIEWPKVQKRSLDESISITLPLAQKNVNLHLKLAAPIVGPNTPVYTLRTTNGQVYADINTPFKEYTLNIYEDEDQQASMVVDIDANGNKYIQSGIIESQNISIHRAPNRENVQQGTSYIVRLIDAFLYGGQTPIRSSINTPTVSSVRIPDVIYPEILVMVDSSIYDKYGHNFDKFKNYILNFWTSVNQKYKSLSGPKYKLSIAGIVVAKDRSAFEFVDSHSSRTNLDFENALIAMGVWLYNNRNIIPIESYDVAMVHTLLNAFILPEHRISGARTLGLANLASACQVYHGQRVMKTSIVFDDNNFGFIYTAAHELGHMLGAGHDDDLGCDSQLFIMTAVSPSDMRFRKITWSQCSINDFHQFLRTNPTCLFNVPESYQKNVRRTTTPRPEIDIDDIYNEVDTDSVNPKSDDSDDDRKINTNNRRRESRPIIPADKLNEFIPRTNTRYSDLAHLQFQHISVRANFDEFILDLQNMLSNQVIYGQIVNKSDIFIYTLNKATQNIPTTTWYGQRNNNGFLVWNNNEEPRVANPWNNNYGGNFRISVNRQPRTRTGFTWTY